MSVIREVGSFYAGGRLHRRDGFPVSEVDLASTLAGFRYDPNGTFAVESCYVQYFLPSLEKGDPVVLIHGGALTGAMWESTPAGNKGWVQLLLERGHPVYVIDGVERGRAGFVPFQDVWPDQPMLRSAEEAWGLYRIGAYADYAVRRSYPGQKFPVDFFDQFLRFTVPRWLSTPEAAYQAYREALRRIGPAILFVHSSGGVNGPRLARDEPELVRAVVGIEPSTFHPADAFAHPVPILNIMGDFLDSSDFWARLDGTIREQTELQRAAGASAEYLRLKDFSLPGHSHMYMMDDGNDKVLDLVLALVSEHLHR